MGSGGGDWPPDFISGPPTSDTYQHLCNTDFTFALVIEFSTNTQLGNVGISVEHL